jgi:hypothetical protein
MSTMSNEKMLEEILYQAHELGIQEQVFELVSKFKHQNLVDRYHQALTELKSQLITETEKK